MPNPKNDGLTADELRAALLYDPSTGVFYRTLANGVKKVAGTIKRSNYVHIFIGGRQRFAHRLAWLYVHGAWPDGVIDHIDGNTLNNRIDNLRDGSQAMNASNRTKVSSAKTSSKYVGVHFYKKVAAKPWTAQITINSQRFYLGRFDTENEARDAYIAARSAS